MTAGGGLVKRGPYLGMVIFGVVLQLAYVLGFALLVQYNPKNTSGKSSQTIKADEQDEVNLTFYGHFQDVQAMIFIGFGFLMTFLKRYGFSSVGFNMFLSALFIQQAIFCNSIAHGFKVSLDVQTLLNAEFAAATVLISFGAVLGKCTPIQYMVMGFVELFLFAGNEYLGREVLHAVDAGDSMYVHAFGAYFGLGLSSMLASSKAVSENVNEGSTYNSDLFAMIGTTVLWIFWPSFNSGGCTGVARSRAIVNTVVSLLGSTVATFLVCSLMPSPGVEVEETGPGDLELIEQSQGMLGAKDKALPRNGVKKRFQLRGTLDMVCVQNATLAGGVAIGTAADMVIGLHGACLVGILAGTVSVLGYKLLTPLLNRRLVHDTCGVHNLHGMPAVLAGLVGAVVTCMASQESWGDALTEVFPLLKEDEPLKRTVQAQAGFQALATLISVILGLLGGLVTGVVLRFVPAGHLPVAKAFDDAYTWHVPGDEEDAD